MPIGLYRLQPVGKLAVTELVAVQPPEPLATFLADRRYLPRGIPMLKRVLALTGQTVCRDHLTITVDKIWVGEAREHDSRGRPLPIWQGCRVVADGEVFLMNWQSADSLDGRYFGVLPTSAIIGTGGASLDRRGGMTLPQNCKSSVIPLFGQNTDHSSVPAEISHGRRAERRSRAAVRPARQRFTLDGREHDGSLAISRDDAVHRGDLGSVDAVERCSARRAERRRRRIERAVNPSIPSRLLSPKRPGVSLCRNIGYAR